ncbi:MAG: hypothetical protein U5R14_03995 [Gemmatimonadota bacterium]|nr:hypothetical protein [Gemmatimonadota bacterium]
MDELSTRRRWRGDDGALSERATLGEGGIGNFIYQAVQQVLESDPDFDWGRFDNDGPDGIPNSGDDDGYVDALAVMHPTPGAECDGDLSRIWSHKWNLRRGARGMRKASASRSRPRRCGPGVARSGSTTTSSCPRWPVRISRRAPGA